MSYTGIAFPFMFGTNGGISTSTAGTEDITHILEAIGQLLATQVDEREHEAYGSDLNKVVFSNGDDTDLAEANLYVREALVAFETRVKVLNVNCTYDKDSNSILIDMSLEYIKTGETVNAGFTFNEDGGITWTT